MSARAVCDALTIATLLLDSVVLTWLWMNRGKWEDGSLDGPSPSSSRKLNGVGPPTPKTGL